LTINIVVMLVVGMVALAALIAIIPKSKEYLTVDVIDITIDDGTPQDGKHFAVRGGGEYEVRANVKVMIKIIILSQRQVLLSAEGRIWNRPDKQ